MKDFFQKLIRIVLFPFKLLLLALIYLYKILISPLLPKSCIYLPTCSTYAINAIKEFGVLRGFLLSVKRILRCNPWAKGGWDPVPINIKGDHKWIL